MDPPRIDVDAARELALDHGAVRLGVIDRQPDVFVEQERRGGGERHPSVAVAPDQLVVHGKWGTARGEAEYGSGVTAQERLDGVGNDAGDVLAGRRDDDFHVLVSSLDNRSAKTSPVPWTAMSFETPPPDLAKLIAAWEQWESGEEAPGRVLASLKTAGLPVVLKQLSDSGWTPAD